VQNPNHILQETQSRPRLAVRAEVLLEALPRLADLILVGLGDRVIDTVIRLVLRVELLQQVDEAPLEVSLRETELAGFLGCVDLFQPGLLLGISRWAGEVFETLAVFLVLALLAVAGLQADLVLPLVEVGDGVTAGINVGAVSLPVTHVYKYKQYPTQEVAVDSAFGR